MRRILASAARDDHAIGHNGTAGIADVQFATAIGLPHHLACARAERDHDVVPAYEIDLVAADSDAALALSETVAERPGRRKGMPILPHEVAGRGIDCLDHIAGITQIHHAVVNERRGLVGARLHRSRPNQLHVLHIGFVDLVQRTVAPGLIVAAMDYPILWFRCPQRLVAHGDEIRHGANCLRWRRRCRRLRASRQCHAA
jgi:hypothetical protein